MTETIEFMAIIGVCVTIVGWYVMNDAAGLDGGAGLLALKPDEALARAAQAAKRYRMKARTALRRRDMRARPEDGEMTPTYRMREDAAAARTRFRRQDEARYLVKDRIAYHETPQAKPAD